MHGQCAEGGKVHFDGPFDLFQQIQTIKQLILRPRVKCVCD
jgi:hypothetical protein